MRGFSGVWITDTKTGKVRFCTAFTEIMYESDHVNTTPRCTKWSDDQVKRKAGGETAGLLATGAKVSTHPSCLTKMTSQDCAPTDVEKDACDYRRKIRIYYIYLIVAYQHYPI